MLKSILKFLGLYDDTNYKDLVQSGAIILDVRTKSEFNSGHIKGAINIPLNDLSSQLGKLKKDKAIITCCASGMRSASAKGLLQSKGYSKVYNGKAWHQLNRKILS
jgi:rhodanese-related sulfurtransferase